MIKRYLTVITLGFFICSMQAVPDQPKKEVVLPIVGDKNTMYTGFDDALIKFVKSKGYEACTAAISKDKNIVHTIGIGWNDKEKTQPINIGSRMRIASVTKGITLIALYKLMQGKAFNRDTKFWEFFNYNPKVSLFFGKQSQPTFAYKKIWQYTPSGMPEPRDPRVKSINIGQLIEHKGGWDDRSIGFDPQSSPEMIKQALSLKDNPTPHDIIYYMLTIQRLVFAPGTTFSYSNFGYNILGRVVERASGKNYIDYLKTEIFAPLGITDIDLAHTNKRGSNEIWYAKNDDQGYLIEDMDSHGGLIASVTDLSRIFNNYWVTGEPRKGQNFTWWLTGSLPTTTAAVYQTKNITVVVLINDRINQYEQANLNELFDLIKKTVPIK